ncbi:MAG: PilN domain-containing protein [Bacillota bacterium]
MYRVNLLPPELRPKTSNVIIKLPKGPGIWIALGVVVLVVVYLAFLFSLKSTESQVSRTRAEIDALKPVLSRVKNTKIKVDELEQEASAFKKLLDERRSWYAVLEDVGAIMPTDVWLIDVSSDANGALVLKGSSATFGAVGYFVYQLSTLEHFQSVTLKSVIRVQEGTSEMNNFEIVAALALKEGS